jgi:hypothetical protein
MKGSIRALLILLVPAAFVGVGSGVTSQKTGPTSDAIKHDLAQRGAAAVIESLRSQPERWASICRGISSGDRAWLEIGKDLARAADGGRAREIHLAFGDALSVAPEAALALAPELRLACGDIDDPFTESLQKAMAEVERRIASVQAVRDASLKQQKSYCLEKLDQLRKALPNAYGKKS